MEHRGIEFQVVQLMDARGGGGMRAGWRWWVKITPYVSASGTEANEADAMNAAVDAIDRALGPMNLMPKQRGP
jgi:hypothetical protein